jgi:hypothetical protein
MRVSERRQFHAMLFGQFGQIQIGKLPAGLHGDRCGEKSSPVIRTGFLHAQASPKKISISGDHFDRSFSFMAMEGKQRNQKERKKNESAKSVQENTNSTTSHRTGPHHWARECRRPIGGTGDLLE